LRYLAKDKLVTIAAIILALIVAVVLFTTFSDLPVEHPLFGVFIYATIPVLFVSGAVVFIIAVLRS
jgi:hypothetical protein